MFGPIVHYILALCTHSSAYLNCHCLVVYLNGPVQLSLFTLCLQTLFLYICWRPYHVECTGSLLTSEVKRHRARLVLGWGTAWEDLRVLPASPAKQGKTQLVKTLGLRVLLATEAADWEKCVAEN